MMSQFRDDYTFAASDLDEYFGGIVFYTDPQTTRIELDATIHKEVRERRMKSDGGIDWISTRSVYIFDRNKRTLPNIRRDGKIEIDGQDHSILEVGHTSEGRRRIKVMRAAAAEVSRKDYRK